MNAASPPGATTWTPFGFASRVATLATTRCVPPPSETAIPVRSRTTLRMRSAVAASSSPFSIRSVPVKSR